MRRGWSWSRKSWRGTAKALAVVLAAGTLSPVAAQRDAAASPPALGGTSAAAPTVQGSPGQFTAVQWTPLASGVTVPAQSSVAVDAAGQAGLPATGLGAVAVNVAAQSVAAGSLLVRGSDEAPSADVKSLTYSPGTPARAFALPAVGADGKIVLANRGASPVVVSLDVEGYVTGSGGGSPAARYVPLKPENALAATDTAAGGTRTFTVGGSGGVPESGVSAVVIRVAGTGTTSAGAVSVFPAGETPPASAVLEYPQSGAATNLAVVVPSASGVTVRNDGPAQAALSADVVGYFVRPDAPVAGTAYVPVTPAGLLGGAITLPAGGRTPVNVAGQAGVPAERLGAVAVNISATGSGSGTLIASQVSGGEPSGTVTLAYNAGVPAQAFDLVKVGSAVADQPFELVNTGDADVSVTLDLFGYFKAAAVPDAPANAQATAGTGQASVSWTAPADGGAPITAYKVTADPGGQTVEVRDGQTTATVQGLDNGTAYTFTVTAANPAGVSAPSSASNQITPLGPPGAPTGVTATPGTGQATVSWTAPSDTGGSPITGYTVTATPGGYSVTVPATAATATVTGLTNGTAYTFTVTAANAFGTATAGTSGPVTPEAPPGAPTEAAATRGDGEATVTWRAPADTGGNPVTGYTVTAAPGGQTANVDGDTTQATVTGLTNGTAYTFTVTATTSAGTSGVSAPSAPVTPAGRPIAPIQVSAIPGDGQASVTWTASADNGSPVTGYTVTASPGGRTTTVTETEATVTGLENGQSYTFAVKAVNDVGASAQSEPSTPVTPDDSASAASAMAQAEPPGAPTGVSATAGMGEATVTWTAPTDTGGAPLTGYTVTSSPEGHTVTVDGTTTTATVTGLYNGRAYSFVVTAVNEAGPGTASAASEEVVPVSLLPPPQQVTAAPGDGEATISWAAPAGTVTEYVVTASPGGASVTVPGNETTASVTGLENGTAYTFTVLPRDEYGDGPLSEPSTPVTPAGVPVAPSGVRADPGAQKVTLTWSEASPNGTPVTGYLVKVVGTPRTIEAPPDRLTAIVDGLVNGTSYSFTVAAVNAVGTGADSEPVSATPVGEPSPPTGVEAVPSDGQAAVSWTAPTDTGGVPLTGYTVTAEPGGRSASVDEASTTTVIDGLSNGTAYTFTVTATNGVQKSDASAPSSPVTPKAVPTAPTNVLGVPGDGQVTVTWDTPYSAGGDDITSYAVTVSPGGRTVTVGADEVTATVTGLANGTAYTFTVLARGPTGDGPASEPSAPVTPASAPDAPTGVTATIAGGSATVSWTAPASDGGAPIGSYRVLSHPDGRAVTVAGDQTTATVTGLGNGTAYTFTVIAANSAGQSPESAPSEPATGRAVPGAPSKVIAAAADGQAIVTWAGPQDDGGAAITSYAVTAAPGGQTATVAGDQTTAVVNGLTNGTAYTFTVTATNAVGTGEASFASAPVTPAAAPGPPAQVTATAGNGAATVSWTAPGNTGGVPLTGYTVTAAPGGKTVTVTSTTATVTGLTNGQAYTFTVKARNALTEGAPSAPSDPVSPTGPAQPPTDVTATPGNTTATVAWTPPANDGGSAITSYTVTPVEKTSQAATVSAPQTSVVITGLTNGTAYTFKVTAINAKGTSAASAASAAVTPAAAPGAPTAVQAIAGDTRTRVSWTAPTSTGGAPITGYTVTSAPDGRTATVNGSQTYATVEGLTNGTSYTFTVTATNRAGTGAASTPSAAVTPSDKSAAPTQVVAVAGNASAEISWTAPQSPPTSITSYRITSSPGTKVVTVSGSTTTTTFTGLTNGTSYTFTVTAVYSNSTTAASEPSGVARPVGPPPAPYKPGLSVTNGGVWVQTTSLSGTGGSPITGYTITVSPGGRTVQAKPGADGKLAWTGVSGLANGTSYTFTLTATNAYGTSAPSPASDAAVPKYTEATVSEVVATAGDGQATVTWKPPAGVTASGYTIYATAVTGGAEPSVSAGGTSTSATLTGLTNGSTYTFTVKVSGESVLSTSTPVTPRAAGTGPRPPEPVAPEGLFQENDGQGPTVAPTTISKNTVWSPQGSPYVVNNYLSVQKGASLTLLPGTVVKLAKQSAWIAAEGQLLSLGTAEDPVIITSLKDDSALGDTNGDGAATVPQAGDWFNVRVYGLAVSSPVSVFDHTEFRYGGWGSGNVQCSAGYAELNVERNARVMVSNSRFTDSLYSGVSLTGPSEDAAFLGVYNNVFTRSGSGIKLQSERADIIGNHFDSSLVGPGLCSLFPKKTRFWYNTMLAGAPLTVTGTPAPTRKEFDARFNRLGGGFERFGTAAQELQDLTNNWWGRDLRTEDLPDCMTQSQADAYSPPVALTPSPDCPVGQLKPDGFVSKVSGALTVDPAAIPMAMAEGQQPMFGPVQTASGILTYGTQDLEVQDAGLAIQATRYYSSGRPRGAKDANGSGDQGAGWTSAFSEGLSGLDLQASMSLPDGSSIPLPSDVVGGYVPGGSSVRMTRDETGSTVSLQGQTYKFDPAGELQELTRNDKGHKLTIQRAGGRPAKVTGVSGRFLAYDRQGGLIQKITDSTGRQAAYGYQGGRLAWAKGVDGQTESYAYDGEGRLTKVTTPMGRVKLAAGYRADGRVAWVEQQGTGRATFAYDLDERKTTVTLADGSTLVHYYDNAGRLVSQQAGDSVERTIYDGEGRPAVRIEGVPSGAMDGYAPLATATLFDADGNQVLEASPEGVGSYTTYNDDDKPLVTTYSDGTTVSRAYDGEGRLESVTDQRGNVTEYAFNDHGLETEETDPLGRTTTRTYDEDDLDLLKVADSTGATTTYGYDPQGRPTSITSGGNTRKIAYTAYDAPWRVTLPRGGAYTLTYDRDRSQTSKTDPTGNKTVYSYDSEGRLKSVTYPETDPQTGQLPEMRLQYDVLGRVKKVTDPEGGETVAEYTPEGWRESVTDPMGRKTRYAFDPAGRAYRTVSAAGTPLEQTKQLVYDRDGRILRSDLPDGTSQAARYDLLGRLAAERLPLTKSEIDSYGDVGWQQFTYDAAGNVTKVVEAAGGTVEYTYDASGRPLTKKDQTGNVTKFAYDDAKRTRTATDKLGVVSVTTFDASGNVIAERNGEGETTRTAYNADGQIEKVVYPDGATVSYTHDLAGRRTSQTDPSGRTVSVVYDAMGRIKKRTFPAAGFEEFAYDGNGNLIRRTDQNGQAWTYGFNAVNELIGSTDPLQHSTTYGYDGLGRMTRVTDPTGVVQNIAYDPMGRPAVVSDGNGASWITRYDGPGRPVKRTDPAGRVTSAAYDWAGRVKELAPDSWTKINFGYDAAGHLTSRTSKGYGPVYGLTTGTWKYDARGRLASSTDALGNATTFGYDDADRPTSQTLPGGAVITATYHPSGRVKTVTGPAQGTTAYSYFPDGSLKKVTRPRGGEYEYTYDDAGRLQTAEDPLGAVTAYGYDAVGRPTTMSLPSGRVLTSEYDAAGRQVALKAQLSAGGPVAGLRTYAYDSAGRPTSVTETTDAVRSVNLQYDGLGQLQSSDNGQGVTTYTYDAAHQLASKRAPGGAVTTYRYGAFAQLREVRGGANIDYRYTYGQDQSTGYTTDLTETITDLDKYANATTTRTTDALGRLTGTGTERSSASSTPSYEETATYRPDGEVATRAQSAPGNAASGSKVFEYDDAGRLTGETLTRKDGGQAAVTYAWDADGDRTKTTTDGHEVTTQFNLAGQPTSSSDGRQYQYDADGRLTAVTGVADTEEHYTYNAFGEMASAQKGSKTVTYQRDPLGRLLSRSSEGSTDTFTYDALGSNGFQPSAGPATEIVRAPGGAVIGQNTGSTRNLAVASLSGDSAALHDTATDTVNFSGIYDGFGQATTTTSMSPSAPLGYQGAVTDGTTGQVLVGSGFYDPSTGRPNLSGAGAEPSGSAYLRSGLGAPIELHRYTFAQGGPTYFLSSQARSPEWAAKQRSGDFSAMSKAISETAGYLLKLSSYYAAMAEYRARLAAYKKLYDQWKQESQLGSTPRSDAFAIPFCAPGDARCQLTSFIDGFIDSLTGGILDTIDAFIDPAQAVQDFLDGVERFVSDPQQAFADLLAAYRANPSYFMGTLLAGLVPLFFSRGKSLPKLMDKLLKFKPRDRVDVPDVTHHDHGEPDYPEEHGSAPEAPTPPKAPEKPDAPDVPDPPRPATPEAPSRPGTACPANSFTAGTRVLMADGTRKPIEKVEPGDRVLTTDPATGRTTAHTVVAPVTGAGEKHLVELTIDTDGRKGSKTAELTATDHHPFWVPSLNRWLDAAQLLPGMWLRTSAGTHVQLTAVRTWTQRTTAHSLTIAGVHTFYALAGSTPVLVHNCGTATVYLHPADPRTGIGHASVRIDGPEESLHIHQVAPGGMEGPTYVQRWRGPVPEGSEVYTFDLPTVDQALAQARGALRLSSGVDRTSLGQYNIATNSCVTICGVMLRAGGVPEVPRNAAKIILWLKGLPYDDLPD